MPLFYQQDINLSTRLGVWKIEEDESFFSSRVPLQREITHPHKRLQHLAGRALLRELVPDFPYELIRIADTRKPFLPDEQYHFSISHAGDHAAVIVSKDHRVGIDVELVSPKVMKVLHKFLSLQERALLSTGEDPSRYETLFWSIKEAMFKWHGAGGIDFREHLRILELDKRSGSAVCMFLQDEPVRFSAGFRFFDDLCLSWVNTPARR